MSDVGVSFSVRAADLGSSKGRLNVEQWGPLCRPLLSVDAPVLESPWPLSPVIARPVSPTDRLTSYVFRVFALTYSTMTTSVVDLPSLCATANWIITQRQAEDGHFLEKGPVIMASMQVPTAPLPGLLEQNPGLWALIGKSQAPDLLTGKTRTGKGEGPAPSFKSLCSGPPCPLLQC